MMKIVVRDRVWVDGRGQIFVAHPEDHDGFDLRTLNGELVEADGKTWRVAGVESFAIEMGGSYKIFPVGLLVRPAQGGSGSAPGG